MNGKRAKYLRRIARHMTAGKPERKYMLGGRYRQLITTCTRRVYQDIKRSLRRRRNLPVPQIDGKSA